MSMKIEVTLVGPMACGKTRLADKLEEFLKTEAGLIPGQNTVRIVEYTGHDMGVSDRRNTRETKFDV